MTMSDREIKAEMVDVGDGRPAMVWTDEEEQPWMTVQECNINQEPLGRTTQARKSEDRPPSSCYFKPWLSLMAVILLYSSTRTFAMASSIIPPSLRSSWRSSTDVSSPVSLWHDNGRVNQSTSLSWESVHDLKDFRFAVEAGGDHNTWQYVCRARQGGEWVPGRGTTHRMCYVPWRGKEYAHTSFQVLITPELSANTRWFSFKKKTRTPNGALVTAGFNIIRQEDPESDLGVSIGRYNYTKGAEIVLRTPRHNYHPTSNQPSSELEEDDTREVLVELESVKYQLTNLAFKSQSDPSGFPPKSEESVLLASDFLKNPTDQTLSLNVEIPYNYTESMRITDVVGTKPGVPTVFDIRSPVELIGGHRVYLRDYGFFGKGWGETVTRVYSNIASAFVDEVSPKTTIPVSVLGRLGLFDLNFTGSLRATYDDGSTITRIVTGVLKLKKYLDVGVAYGMATNLDSVEAENELYEKQEATNDESSKLTNKLDVEEDISEDELSADDPLNFHSSMEENSPTRKVNSEVKESSSVPTPSSKASKTTDEVPLLIDNPAARMQKTSSFLGLSLASAAANHSANHVEARWQLQEIREDQLFTSKNGNPSLPPSLSGSALSANVPCANFLRFWHTLFFLILVLIFHKSAICCRGFAGRSNKREC